MNIEKLAFKNYYELINIQKIDLLLIIEFLQKDRKQWINQFTQTHNESVEIQKENKQLKEQLLVAQTNEETFRLEMKDITKTLGLDEDTIFDDVKVCVKNLKDNWNKLKEYLFDIRKRGFALQNLANVTKNTEPNIAILIIINKLQELEQGSDSNVED